MKLAETVQIVVFGAKTETEFRSVSNVKCIKYKKLHMKRLAIGKRPSRILRSSLLDRSLYHLLISGL